MKPFERQEFAQNQEVRALKRFNEKLKRSIACLPKMDTGFRRHALEQFQDKWIPVIRSELRKIKKLEPCFDSIKIGYALGGLAFILARLCT